MLETTNNWFEWVTILYQKYQASFHTAMENGLKFVLKS